MSTRGLFTKAKEYNVMCIIKDTSEAFWYLKLNIETPYFH